MSLENEHFLERKYRECFVHGRALHQECKRQQKEISILSAKLSFAMAALMDVKHFGYVEIEEALEKIGDLK